MTAKNLRHYKVYPDARIYNTLTDHWLTPTQFNSAAHLRGRAPKYYRKVRLSFGGENKNRLVHRVVAKLHVPNPRPDLFDIVDHINGNGLDNRAENLRWVNVKLNAMTRARHPRYVEGRGWQIHVNYRKKMFFATLEMAEAYAKYTSDYDFERLYNLMINSTAAVAADVALLPVQALPLLSRDGSSVSTSVAL